MDTLPGKWAPATIYRPFELIPSPLSVRLIIIGQDPYHTPEMATGLAFGVPRDTQRLPPSLKNIVKKYRVKDVSLEAWAEAGVLLINTSLTVEIGKPYSHAKYWRKPMQDMLINLIKHFKAETHRVHFVLWGAKAINLYRKLDADTNGHTFCASSHPSPLSCRRPVADHPAFTSPCVVENCQCHLLSQADAPTSSV